MHAQDLTLTPELLWQVGRVTLEDASADGSKVLYSVATPDVEANTLRTRVWLLDRSTRQNTPLAEGMEQPRFSPDGTEITYLSESILHRQSIDGRGEKAVSAQTINTEYLISPKGSYILSHDAVTYLEPPSKTNPDLPKTTGRIYDGLFYRHWKSWDNGKRNNYFLSAKGKDGTFQAPINIIKLPFNTPTKPYGDISEAIFSPDERFVVYTCRASTGTAESQSTNTDLFLYDIKAGKTVNITEGLPGYDREPAFSPDGNYLLWTSMATPQYEADRPRLMILDTRTNVRTDYTTNWNYEVNHPQWSKDGKSVFFISAQDFTYQIYQMDIATKQIKAITNGLHDYDKFVVTDQGLIATKHSMSQPNEVYHVDVRTGVETQLSFATQNPWGTIKKGKVERHSVKTSDGKDMNVWLVLPPDFDPTKKYPALLYCQGGPQSPLSQLFSYRWNMQLMASQGYVVIAPCRRGMQGSGQDWNHAISKDWGGQAMQDLLSATDHMAKKPFIDAKRIAAVGASYGGYSVYWLAGNHQKRYKTFISHCGLFNLESFYGTTEELFFAAYDLGKPYWEDATTETWLKDSPHRYAKNWDTPILVIHNELDFRVPLSEGMQAYQVAQLKGLKSRLLVFPDEGHHVTKPQNSLLWQRTFFDWLKETL